MEKKQSNSLAKWLTISFLSFTTATLIGGWQVYRHISNDLPNIMTLHDVQYQIPLSIYSSDNLLIAQFGEKQRIPVAIKNIPPQLIKAFLAAEDGNFFEHSGVDINGLLRAALQLVTTGKKSQGGSTITMQVTRNFLLSSEKTFTRKLKEIILARKIEKEYTKEEILELYLNQIFMGHRAYGIAAAAQIYYGKTLEDLTLAEQAMIAGLPKAPSAYNPVTNVERALQRRNYVLRRMAELGYITQQAADLAANAPATAKLQIVATPQMSAPYLAEMVRQKLYDEYGEQIYTSGFKVYTTVSSTLQNAADKALYKTLHAYDRRHRLGSYKIESNNVKFKDLPVIGDTLPASVIKTSADKVSVRLQNDTTIDAPTRGVKLGSGDIVRVRPLENNRWELARVPNVEGAFTAINPQNGAIVALNGGFDFERNKYNRATQSKRQPGSGFKPIIYTTALEEGYTPASVINDGPITINVPGQREWRPENYSKRFYGPTSLRTAITYSRNIISIRLLKEIGIDKAVATALRFGFTDDQLPKALSLALGSGYATTLDMARMYAVFANGGFLVKPYFIDRIESYTGETIFQAKPKIACPECSTDRELTSEYAPRIISPRICFLMTSLLQDVIQKGTATDAKVLHRSDIAGKTGTTNDQRDAWFNGFSPTMAASAWVGHDNFSPLGNAETGGVAALPMWIDFMRTALKNTPDKPLKSPAGIEKVFVNKQSGNLASSGSAEGAWEFFQKELIPTKKHQPPSKPKPKAVAKKDSEESSVQKSVESLF